MLRLNNVLERLSLREKGHRNLTTFDQVTKSVAIAVSRRTFIRQIVASGTAVGLAMWEVLPVYAASCNYCASVCGCAVSVECSSPNRQYRYYKSCSLGPGCIDLPGFGRTYAYITACDDGTKSHGCGYCVF